MVFGRVEVGRAGSAGPAGHSYRGVLVRAPREAVLARAVKARFSGWVGPQEGEHVVLVPASRHLVVASGGRDLEALAGDLAEDLGPALLVEVVRDRLLALVLRTGADEDPPRYLSDPSVLDEEDLDEPRGAQHARSIATAFGRGPAGERLREALAESLDPEQDIESERVMRVLDLLGLPTWLVSAWALPRPPSTGPTRRELTRLRAGVQGPGGIVVERVVEPVRRARQLLSRRPDGPRPDGLAVEGPDETMLW